MPKRRIEININDVFGWLTVLESANKDIYKNHQFKCICRCGREVIVKSSNLRTNNNKSCGCCKGKKTFNDVETRESNTNNTLVEIQCSVCKEIKLANTNNFQKSKSKKSGYVGCCRHCCNSGQRRIKSILVNYNITDKKKGLVCDLDLEFMLETLKEGVECHYCGIKQDNKLKILGLDRIDNNLGHLKNNVLPCCGECNVVRRDIYTVEQMKRLFGPAIKRAREEEINAEKSINNRSRTNI